MRGTRRLVIAAGCTGGSKEDEVGVVSSDISRKNALREDGLFDIADNNNGFFGLTLIIRYFKY